MKNTKTTKRALLSSLVALFLCVAMLAGTTFAWFTDSASSAVNKIQAGNLDVALEMKNAEGNWVNAEGQTLGWVTADGRAQNEIFWEPGCTYQLPELRIVNNGSLALKYKIIITGIVGDARLLEVIDFTYGEGIDINAEVSLAPNAATEGIIIKGHMAESAGNEYQGLSIDGIGITVVATQVSSESDSFGDIYDKDAEYALPVATSADLAEALASGNDVILTAPVQMPNAIEITGNVTIYGSENGKLLAPDNDNRVINVNDNTEPVTLTLSGVEVIGPTTGTYTRGVSVYANTDVTIVVDNSSVSASYYAINIAGANENVDVVVKNATITGWCAFQTWSAGTKATFENCTLIGNNDKGYNADGVNDFATIVINTNTTDTELTFKNCRIEANQTTGNNQYLLSIRAAGAKVTMDGCTFFADGAEIAAGSLKGYISVYTPEALDFDMTIDGGVLTTDDVTLG